MSIIEEIHYKNILLKVYRNFIIDLMDFNGYSRNFILDKISEMEERTIEIMREERRSKELKGDDKK